MAKTFKPQIVSANRLTDGAIVFLRADDGWSSSLDEAWFVEDETALAAALARAQTDAKDNAVVAIEAFEVRRTEKGVVPERLRDRIRVNGPTIAAGCEPHTPPVAADAGGAIDPSI